MQNRPTSFLHESNPVERSSSSFDLNRNPLGRLLTLFVLLVAPLLPVAIRLFQLQSRLADEFIGSGRATVTESFEEIPTTSGRILVGGTVLAEDSATYRLKMHYRWLEEPVDDLWLRMKAWSRLNRSDRRNRDRVKAAEQEILAERRQMWRRLAEALQISPEEFRKQRLIVQQRVERIIALVEERQQQERAREHARQSAFRESDSDRSTVDRILSVVETELTTPPRRSQAEPIVVTEELDYHVIARDVPFERIVELITRPDLYPGIDFELITRREYPQGAFASHVVGYRQIFAANEDEAVDTRPLLTDERPQVGDFTGRTGIEKFYDPQLRGRRGLLRTVRNADGEIIRREIVREARPGSDLILTLDESLQRRAEQILDRDVIGQEPIAWQPPTEMASPDADEFRSDSVTETDPLSDQSTIARQNVYPKGACLIAMNVHTGEILAAACAPRFDLRLLVDHNEELWQKLQADPRQPLFPRLTKMALPPGSVFKAVTALAALNEPDFDPAATVYCRGYLNVPHRHRCYHSHAHFDTTLEDAICRSCNVYFFTVAGNMGAGPLVRTAQRMGFGQPTGIDLPGEVSGNLPRLPTDTAITLASFEQPAVGDESATRQAASLAASRPQRIDPLGLAIGQSTLTATPLQIVRLMAAVANGGNLVTPRVVRQVKRHHAALGGLVSESGGASESKLPEITPTSDTGLSERSLHFLRSGLEKVVASPRGTAYRRARLDSVSIAGKTGTAETGGGRPDHAWFAGYVPAERPQIAFVAVVEHGGSGGVTAGPIAKQLVEELLKQNLIVPPATDQPSR